MAPTPTSEVLRGPRAGSYAPAVRASAATVDAPVVAGPRPAALRVKHTADAVLAALILLLLVPVLLLIAAAVASSSGGSVVYRQRRVGRDGRAFDIFKFRSMHPSDVTVPCPRCPGLAPGGIEGADRRTRVGRFLRRTSLDELPQLVNVLRGEMSLVGPRPERPEFVQLFADEVPNYADRHRVRVGMTGLAQVRGLRGQTSIAARAAADNEYIDGWSLWLDVKVLALTLRAVVRPAE